MKIRKRVIVDTGEVVALIKKEKEGKISLPLNKGKYKITLSSSNNWNGKTSSYNFLDLKEDSFLCVADGFEENNGRVITPKDLYKKGCSLSLGGDGDFMISIEITPVSKIGSDPFKSLLSEAKSFLKGKKYSDVLAEEFSEKFLKNVYYQKIAGLLSKKRSADLERSLKALEKFLQKTESKNK